MDIKSLKNKILQLAIQGKLVPQDENDESASVLLENIKAEKEQLIKDKVIKKEKPLPEISEEEIPFKIPSNWKWARLVELSKNCEVPFADGPFGSNLKSIHYTDNPEVRIIQLSNIGEDGWRDSNVRYTTFKHAETIKRSMVECGDLVIAKMMPAGRTIEVPDIEKAYVLSSDAVKFVPHPKLDKKYLLYTINSTVFKKQINSQVQGTTRVRTSLTKLKGYLVPVPPIEEQKRIVAKLDELFKLIDKLDNNKQELLENISNTRNKVLQLAIQGKLVEQCENDEPASVLLERIKAEKEQLIKDKVIKKEKPLPEISEEEKSFDLPKGWEWCRLGEISIKITDGSHNPPKGEDGITDYMMLSSQNINQNTLVNLEKTRYLSEENYNIENKRTQIKIGDILLTIVGTIGRSCIYNGSLNITLQRSVAVVDTKYCNRYLKYLFDSPLIQKYFSENSSGTAQKGIYLNQLKQTILPLPPLEEQKRIVAKVDLIMNYLDKLQQEIESQEVILEDILK